MIKQTKKKVFKAFNFAACLEASSKESLQFLYIGFQQAFMVHEMNKVTHWQVAFDVYDVNWPTNGLEILETVYDVPNIETAYSLIERLSKDMVN